MSEGFLGKNNDKLNDSIIKLFQTSKNSLITAMFAEDKDTGVEIDKIIEEAEGTLPSDGKLLGKSMSKHSSAAGIQK